MQKRSHPAGTLLFVLILIPALFTQIRGETFVPLTDLARDTYLGFKGGLYQNGGNTIPLDHALEGLDRAAAIRPLDPDGSPDPAGRIVMLSVGMSNAALEFCSIEADGKTCSDWSFMGQAGGNPLVNHHSLVILNGASPGEITANWTSPSAPAYDRIRDEILSPLGLSEQQVQVIWMKHASSEPETSLPDPDADAFSMLALLGTIARTLRMRYPNLQQVFLSSRIYAGYATTTLNPEPYAYEYGFSVKWLIEAQIEQIGGSGIDPLAGDLDYDTVASWIAWGPYLWADGANPRSDGLVWLPEDFEADGTHPSELGQEKVGAALLAFFSSSPVTQSWFIAEHVTFLPVLQVGADGE